MTKNQVNYHSCNDQSREIDPSCRLVEKSMSILTKQLKKYPISTCRARIPKSTNNFIYATDINTASLRKINVKIETIYLADIPGDKKFRNKFSVKDNHRKFSKYGRRLPTAFKKCCPFLDAFFNFSIVLLASLTSASSASSLIQDLKC